ncbi:MAG: hypothetical protein CMJ18_12715 [Phycisphaeraceae bacterium]|nr:hypothetical protein [Phycisphaeraceae bacterium]
MYCRKCSYDLRGSPSNRCPECDREFDPHQPRSYRRKPYRVSPVQKLVLALAIVGVLYTAAYFANVKTGVRNPRTYPNRTSHPIQYLCNVADYKQGDQFSRIAFWPINQADRRFRPDKWSQPAWKARHWSYRHHPRGSNFRYEPKGDGVRFTIEDPNVVQVWTMRFAPAIKVAVRPMLVVRYRARNTDPKPAWYTLWIDDGTGPNGGGFVAIDHHDIEGDGQEHEIRRDLRTFNPKGDLFFFAVGVASGPQGSAVFDLLEIRFDQE